ncbi:MAG TPA: hypothetical protein VG165_06515 [Solirubrobacteraceae bacterium]|jgi:hypothetical protein|nr:hypothetical protein [Solirubrobacteraceae bacterium]
MRPRLVISLLAASAAVAAVVAPASGSTVRTTCLTYPGDTLLDMQGVLRVYAVSVPVRPTPKTVVSVYWCKPGRTARTLLVVEHDDSDGGYTCAPATLDSNESWLAIDCAYVGGTATLDYVYEFPLGTTVGHRTATVSGGSLVGVSTSGGLAVVDECDSTLEVADATGVHVVAPAGVTDPAVGGAHVYWSTATGTGSNTPRGHPKGALTTPGTCD